jgi:hypothetical protein
VGQQDTQKPDQQQPDDVIEIPEGADEATFTLTGAAGESTLTDEGGNGGVVTGTLDVSGFDRLELYVADGRQGYYEGGLAGSSTAGDGGGSSAIVGVTEAGREEVLVHADGGGGQPTRGWPTYWGSPPSTRRPAVVVPVAAKPVMPPI